jgi:hypothetical protein
VLLAPGEAGRSHVLRWLPWMPARDQQWRTSVLVACPACFADPAQGTSLLAMLPLMTTCGEHGCRLQAEVAVRVARLDPASEPPAPPVPSPAPSSPWTGSPGRA